MITYTQLMQTYSGVLQVIDSHPHAYRYCFMDSASFASLIEQGHVAVANQVYVQELLFRAHIAAVTTLFRNERWISGMNSAQRDANYFVFSAALRGLIEAAADSFDCLRHVPGTLHDNFGLFRRALAGERGDALLTCESVENALIHYTHARKQRKSSDAPPTHSAKTSQDYLRSLGEAHAAEIKGLYSELCEVTHPAATTVGVFLADVPGKSGEHLIARARDGYFIERLLRVHSKAIPCVFQLSFNSALVTLYGLNLFDDPRIRTPAIEKMDLTSIPAFNELRSIAARARAL